MLDTEPSMALKWKILASTGWLFRAPSSFHPGYDSIDHNEAFSQGDSFQGGGGRANDTLAIPSNRFKADALQVLRNANRQIRLTVQEGKYVAYESHSGPVDKHIDCYLSI